MRGHVQWAARGEGWQESRAAGGLGASNAPVTRREEDRGTDSAELCVSSTQAATIVLLSNCRPTIGRNPPSESARHGVLVLSVAGCEDLWRRALVHEEVDHVEEAAKVVLVVLTSRDEDDRNAGSNTDGVLCVEILEAKALAQENTIGTRQGDLRPHRQPRFPPEGLSHRPESGERTRYSG